MWLERFLDSIMPGLGNRLRYRHRGDGYRGREKARSRAFSLLLAGGALARVMKLTAGGRGAFTFEGLDRSELLTAFK